MRARLITWGGTALSIGLLVWIYFMFDLRAAWSAIQGAKVEWLFLGTAVYVVLFFLRGWRWSILLAPITPISVPAATSVFLVGFMANNVLPARLGDVARALLLARKHQVSASASFSNVVLERIFDGLTVVGILSLVLWLDPPEAAWVKAVGGGTAFLFVGAMAFAFLAAHRESWLLRVTDRVLMHSPLPESVRQRLLGLISKLARGLGTLKRFKATSMIAGLSVVIWGLEIAVYAIVQRAFGLDVPLSGLALTMSVLTLGLTAPSSPGFVGVFEFLVITTLGVYGVQAAAPAFAITLHLIHYVPGTVGGLVLAWHNGLRLKELRRKASALPQPTSDLDDGSAKSASVGAYES